MHQPYEWTVFRAQWAGSLEGIAERVVLGALASRYPKRCSMAFLLPADPSSFCTLCRECIQYIHAASDISRVEGVTVGVLSRVAGGAGRLSPCRCLSPLPRGGSGLFSRRPC